MSKSILAVTSVALLLASPVAAEEDGFESWDQYQFTLKVRPAKIAQVSTHPATSFPESRHEAKASAEDSSPAGELTGSTEPEDQDYDPFIMFGAGASYAMPYRFADRLAMNRYMAEFSISCAPFTKYAEIGVDIAIDRDNTFLFRPNLKFFLYKSVWFSAYLEGSASILSQSVGSDVGGGAGIGFQIGLMRHLAIDFRVTGVAFFLSGEASDRLVGGNALDSVDSSSFVGFLTAGARLVARF